VLHDLENIEAYLSALAAALAAINREEIRAAVRVLREAREAGKTIFLMGNGGSAATASHIASDLNFWVSHGSARPFKALALGDSSPVVLAIANDIRFEDVFVEQLRNRLEPGDVVVGISGSGNSPNVVRAVEFANGHRAVTLGLCGFDGGRLKATAQHAIHIQADDMQISEDGHLVVTHILMRSLKEDPEREGTASF